MVAGTTKNEPRECHQKLTFPIGNKDACSAKMGHALDSSTIRQNHERQNSMMCGTVGR